MNTFAEPLQQLDRVFVRWRGRKLIYFAGCDYYRLGSHPQILKAIHESLRQYGLTVAASRTTTGNHALYDELERSTARFFAAPRAILTSNGYLANTIAAQGLRGNIKTVIIDARAHPSLQDASQILQCRLIPLKHRDPEHLNRILRRISRADLALMTDGIFAHDGSVAPLGQYRAILGPEPLLWVDDAHAAGVLGKKGRGLVEYFGLHRENLIQTITFSKAFGTYGGAILCHRPHAEQIIHSSLTLTGNTPLPLPITYAAQAALRLRRDDLRATARLQKNISMFWMLVGVIAPSPLVPIIAVAPREPKKLGARLLKRGIYPSFIQYPGGPARGYFRFAISSEHTPAQIDALASVLKTEI